MASSPSTKLQQLLEDYVNNQGRSLDIAVLKDCFQQLSSEQILKIVSKIKNQRSWTVVHAAAVRDHPEVIRAILSSMTQEARDELMRIPSRRGNTAINAAAANGYIEVLECMLELVSPEKRYELMSIQREGGATAVHLLAFYGYTEAMKSTLRVLKPTNRLTLLQMQTEQGDTAIHYAVGEGHTETLKCIMDLLSPNSQVRLLDIQNINNRTPLQHAQYYDHKDTADVILQCREAAESYQNESYDANQDAAGNADLLRRFQRAEKEWIKQLTDLTNEIVQLKDCNAHLTNQMNKEKTHVADVEAIVVQLVRDRDEQAVLLNEKHQRINHFINEIANQSSRITQLTNENEEQNRRISELEVLLARKDVELHASNEEVARQDDKLNRVIHRVMANTEDVEQMQLEHKTATEVVSRCEQKVDIWRRE